MTREKLPKNASYERGAEAAEMFQQDVLAHPEDFVPYALQTAPQDAMVTLERMRAQVAGGNVYAQEQADYLEGFLSRWD